MRSPDPVSASHVPGRLLAALGRARAGAAGVAGGIVTAVAAAGRALAQSPTPSNVVSGDPRSSGQGPGLVGDPGGAIAAVLLVAALALVLTLLYVRATGGPGRRPTG